MDIKIQSKNAFSSETVIYTAGGEIYCRFLPVDLNENGDAIGFSLRKITKPDAAPDAGGYLAFFNAKMENGVFSEDNGLLVGVKAMHVLRDYFSRAIELLEELEEDPLHNAKK